MKYFAILTILLMIGCGLAVALAPQQAVAAGIVPQNCQRDASQNKGLDCNFNDLVLLVVNIINFLFSMVGFVTILFIVYGGLQMLMSGGNPDAIKKGKQTLTNAIVGLVIVLTAFLIITFVVAEATGGQISSFDQLRNFWR